MRKLVVLAVLIPALFLAGCKDPDDPEVKPLRGAFFKLNIGLYNGADSIMYDDVIQVDNVNEYRMEVFKFYLSNIYLMNGSGGKTMLADVIIGDATNPHGFTFVFDAPEGGYEGVQLGIGLDSILNESDPVTFEDEHPLSAAQSMYWSWAAKYRFIRVDGRANENGTIGDGNDLLIAHHPGANEFYRIKNFNKPFQLVDEDTTSFDLKLDVAKWFVGPGGTIDLPTEPQTHTAPTDYHIALKYTDNFAAALELK